MVQIQESARAQVQFWAPAAAAWAEVVLVVLLVVLLAEVSVWVVPW